MPTANGNKGSYGHNRNIISFHSIPKASAANMPTTTFSRGYARDQMEEFTMPTPPSGNMLPWQLARNRRNLGPKCRQQHKTFSVFGGFVKVRASRHVPICRSRKGCPLLFLYSRLCQAFSHRVAPAELLLCRVPCLVHFGQGPPRGTHGLAPNLNPSWWRGRIFCFLSSRLSGRRCRCEIGLSIFVCAATLGSAVDWPDDIRL